MKIKQTHICKVRIDNSHYRLVSVEKNESWNNILNKLQTLVNFKVKGIMMLPSEILVHSSEGWSSLQSFDFKKICLISDLKETIYEKLNNKWNNQLNRKQFAEN